MRPGEARSSVLEWLAEVSFVPSDYAIGEQVHRGLRSRVSRATQLSTGAQVVLKESAAELSLSAAAARLEREFAIAKTIRSQHVVRYLGLQARPGLRRSRRGSVRRCLARHHPG